MVCVGSSSTQSPTGLTTPAAANSTYMYKRCWQRAVTLTGLCCLHAARQLQGIGNAINITSCPPPPPPPPSAAAFLSSAAFHLQAPSWISAVNCTCTACCRLLHICNPELLALSADSAHP
jgi:hypothetical protein